MSKQQTGLLKPAHDSCVPAPGADQLDKAMTTPFGAARFCLNQMQSSVILASYY